MITPGGRVGDASPLGKKPGPRRLDDYTRMVAHALMRDHGYPESTAIAIARRAIEKWSAGQQSGGFAGHVRPQVSAAAAASVIHQKLLDKRRHIENAEPAGEVVELANVTAAKVHAKLAQHYPPHVIGWVKGAQWNRRSVPLSHIRVQPRPGKPHDPAKVAGIREAIRSGKKMGPLVLTDTGTGHLKIADGYHRVKAMQAEGKGTADCYVGKVGQARGPWSRDMHDAKLNT